MSPLPHYRTDFTPRALSDLDEIEAFIAKDSPLMALAFVNKLIDAAEGISPSIRHKVVRRTRPWPVHAMPFGSYEIYFRIQGPSLVRILTIRHGARRQPRKFD